MTTYTLRHHDVTEKIEADNVVDARKLARQWALVGWEPDEATYWVTVYILAEGECVGHIKTAIEPDEPDCTDDEHDWFDLGVHGNGGGIISREVCRRCDLRRTIDTWAQDPTDGEQGLKRTKYDYANETNSQRR